MIFEDFIKKVEFLSHWSGPITRANHTSAKGKEGRIIACVLITPESEIALKNGAKTPQDVFDESIFLTINAERSGEDTHSYTLSIADKASLVLKNARIADCKYTTTEDALKTLGLSNEVIPQKTKYKIGPLNHESMKTLLIYMQQRMELEAALSDDRENLKMALSTNFEQKAWRHSGSDEDGTFNANDIYDIFPNINRKKPNPPSQG